jgi:hypothetical protein
MEQSPATISAIHGGHTCESHAVFGVPGREASMNTRAEPLLVAPHQYARIEKAGGIPLSQIGRGV